MNLNTPALPDLSRPGLPVEQKLRLLADHTLTLERELRFVLEHLDAENLTASFAGSLQRTQRSVQRIEQADYDQQLSRRLSRGDLVDHLHQTEPGQPLDARQGMTLDAKKLDVSALLDAVYPVGSLYLSMSDRSPAELFGGAWERIQDRFLLAAGPTCTAGDTGGEASHTLTAQEMPSHTHRAPDSSGKSDFWFTVNRDLATDATARYRFSPASTGNYFVVATNIGAKDSIGMNDVQQAYATAPAGGGAPHNNLPPYLAVNVWRRIS